MRFRPDNLSLTADLKTRITPYQVGGKPDCSQCGCMASAGLKAISDSRVFGFVPVSSLFRASEAVGRRAAQVLLKDVGGELFRYSGEITLVK